MKRPDSYDAKKAPKRSDRTRIGDEEYLFDGGAWVGFTDPWTPHVVSIEEMKLMKSRLM